MERKLGPLICTVVVTAICFTVLAGRAKRSSAPADTRRELLESRNRWSNTGGGLASVTASAPALLPISFEANIGQAASDLAFLSRSRGYGPLPGGSASESHIQRDSRAIVQEIARRSNTHLHTSLLE